MKNIIACTLGLLGAGAFCAHGESPVSADGQAVPPEKGKSSVTLERQGNAQVKKSAASSAMNQASCVKIGEIKGAFYSVTTGNGAAPGKKEISVTPVKENASSGTPAASDQLAVKKDDRAVVQLALLLDTSSSMNGLINQARTYLWKIVNDMTLARQNGKLPSIQIALYEYGNSNLPSGDSWIRRVLPFTDDLDAVSEELFKLATGGGTECCGAVIDRALKDLEWNTDDPNALKMVFIAGNEPFNQGDVDYASAIARGLEKGITVNTIHCGAANNHDTALWRDGAKKGDGSFFNIDHNAAPMEPETPYDEELAGVSSSLNGTYLAYGSMKTRAAKTLNQQRQDERSRNLSFAASAGRAQAKANKDAYRNTSWDIVDLYEQNGKEAFKLIGKNELPAELEGKSGEELEAVVKQKAAERTELQKKIRKLAEQRTEWLNKWKKEQKGANGGKEPSLDDAIIQAVREQASRKQFSFGEAEGKQKNNSL